MAEEKKTSKKQGTKSTTNRTSAKTKSTKSATKRTSTAKTATKRAAEQRSATKKVSSKKPKVSETKTSDNAKDKSFLVDAAETIDAGAKLVKDRTSEIASDIAEKASGFKDIFFDRVKKGVSEAYEAGSKAIEELTEAAQDYAEKYKHKIEINKLNAKQDKQFSILGSLIFNKYKVAGMTPAKVLNDKDIKELIKDIENTAEQIVEQGKALDKIGK